MLRYFAIVVLMTFIFPVFAHSESFKVVSVQENLEEAVLHDQDTGEQWTVQVGDQVNEWTVTVITRDYVTIFKPQQDQPHLVMKIPVNEGIETFRDHQGQ
ncbi:MAG: hypothetical protein AUJ48_02530 [Deltaproteobacteria bacterium CG1_02_45_11]|nr:MAG: hypothetical protein AUJ48_02530 [Deltaproteobacteria bacterium CG1_02_45_11]